MNLVSSFLFFDNFLLTKFQQKNEIKQGKYPTRIEM